jgi:16S rRNA processing protein RimM
MELVVARIGRPHGVRGEVTIEVRTDSPDRRFRVGATFGTDPASAGPMTLSGVRDHNGTLLLTFDEVRDRTAAEALRDVLLVVDSEADDGIDDTNGAEDDEWPVHALVGLRAELSDGTPAGEVVGLVPASAQDLLVIREPSGHEALVPFVRAIVPVVDVEAGRLVLDPPGGLLQDLPAGDAEA